MAEVYGPKIIREGLILNLDAADINSYPGLGTTWYDVSGNSSNGSLSNGPAYTSNFKGGLAMDGADDYLLTTVTSTTITPTNNWTVSIWCSLNSYPTVSGVAKEGILFGYAYYGGLGVYAISPSTGTVNVYGYFRSDSTSGIFGSYQWTLNSPTMFTVTHETGVGCKFYANGQLDEFSSATGGSWPAYMPNPFALWSPQPGVYGGGSNSYIYYPITTYTTQAYSRALSAQEIQQNYNATKTRFGL